MQFKGDLLLIIAKKPVHARLFLYATLITLILAFGTAYVSEQQAFIYFQF